MRRIIFEDDEMRVISMFDTSKRETALAAVEAVIPLTREDAELSAVVVSTAEKLNVSSQMADRGIMNRDEIREIWNLPALPNGAGQAYTIRGEYYLMNEDGTEVKQ